MVFAPLSSKLTFACSKSPIKTLEKGVKYVLKVNNKNIFEHILVLVTRSWTFSTVTLKKKYWKCARQKNIRKQQLDLKQYVNFAQSQQEGHCNVAISSCYNILEKLIQNPPKHLRWSFLWK